ncbi:hypothetical protein D3C80_1599530 [compost metagenome]
MRAQPSHPQGTKLGDREGFQGLVQNAFKLRCSTSHGEQIGRPHAFDTPSNLEGWIIVQHAVGTDLTVDGCQRLAAAHHFARALQRVHQQQVNVGVRLANAGLQHMLGR